MLGLLHVNQPTPVQIQLWLVPPLGYRDVSRELVLGSFIDSDSNPPLVASFLKVFGIHLRDVRSLTPNTRFGEVLFPTSTFFQSA